MIGLVHPRRRTTVRLPTETQAADPCGWFPRPDRLQGLWARVWSGWTAIADPLHVDFVGRRTTMHLD